MVRKWEVNYEGRARRDKKPTRRLSVIQATFEAGLDAHCNIGDGERWSDSGYILEVKQTGFADE